MLNIQLSAAVLPPLVVAIEIHHSAPQHHHAEQMPAPNRFTSPKPALEEEETEETTHAVESRSIHNSHKIFLPSFDDTIITNRLRFVNSLNVISLLSRSP